jgi:PAS domain S-box-containing protein
MGRVRVKTNRAHANTPDHTRTVQEAFTATDSAINNAQDNTWPVVPERPPIYDLALFYFAFIVAAGFGQWLAIIPGITITLWPPNGVFIATLLLNRRETWPWWILVGFIAELTCNAMWFGNPVPFAVMYFAANAFESIAAAWLLDRYFPKPARLETLRQVIALTVLGAILAPVIGATIGCTINAAIGKNAFTTAWPLWWIGDATGVLIAAPLCLVIADAWRNRAQLIRPPMVEVTALGLCLIAVGAFALGGNLPFAYIIMPPLIWASVRYEFNGAVISVVALALMVAVFTLVGLSQFSGDPASQKYKHIMMQLFLAVSALTTLVVAAVSREHRLALLRLKAANDQLETRVAERTANLRDSEATFRAMFDISSVGKAQVDAATGRFIRVNSALCRMTGYSEAELLASRVFDVTHPDDRGKDQEDVRNLMRGDALDYDIEKRYVRKDGNIMWVRVTANVIRDANGSARRTTAVIQDITDSKLREEHVRMLLGEVNHRGKNMLGVVQAIARQTAASGRADFVQRFSDRIQALSASQDLLVKSAWKGVRLDELVRSQLAHFGELLDRRIFVAGPPVIISPAAAQSIGMAIHELSTNAQKYGALSNADGGVEIAWTLKPAGDVGGQQFSMTWTESGGPPASEPAHRGFGSTVITTMVKGNLSADVRVSYAPKGLVWSVACDAAKVLEGGARQSKVNDAKTVAAPVTGPEQRLLIVEDDVIIAMEIADVLSKAGFSIIGPAHSVQHALDLLEHSPCDAAVLDINLGHETSERVVHWLAQRGTPFITTSGYSRDQQPEVFKNAPFVSKPLRSAKLVAALRDIVGRK